MMQKYGPVIRTACVFGFLLLVILLARGSITAQGEAQPRTVHNACAGNCVADTIFLHSGMGDTQARNAYHGWFNSYYDLTGCGDSAWKTDILFLIDIVGDAVGAPGAPTMQCWQGLAAQASLCSDTCSDYFIEDARYAPNVELSLDSGDPGYYEVTLDNQSNLGKLPELQPNAYSRQFELKTYLTYESGDPLLINETPMPSLSFPNWITRGGLDNCIDQYGFDSSRCELISDFATPSIVSTSVDFLDGVFYELSGQVSDLSDANGSFSQDGYIRLLSDGDSITIAQGPYAGYVLVKTHYLANNTHLVQLTPWDANAGALAISNHECNTWLSTCWFTGARYDADTYVFALQGPQDKVLPGDYTVEVVAEMPHDKDFGDNRVSYSYDASAVENEDSDTGTENENGENQQGGIEDLPVIDLAGPGIYPATINQNELGALFRLSVPDGISFMFLRLVSLDGGHYSAFVRRGSIPVPDYPVIRDEYHCWAQADSEYSGGCAFNNPYPDNYYIFATGWQGAGAIQLEVEWSILAITPTPIPTAMPDQNGQAEESEEGSDQQNTFTEIEPNDDHATANNWDMQQPFSGQLSTWGDRDVVLLDFVEPGIYTFSVTDVGPALKVKMTLVRVSSSNFVDSSTASAKGASAHLMLDASTGDQFYLIISAAAMAPATNQAYNLSLSGFIPDPDESNDSAQTATPWELADGPVTGYFWDKTTGRHDYFTFVAPATLAAGPVTFELTNPSPDLRVRLTLLNDRAMLLSSVPWSAAGQPATLTRVLDPGQRYYLKLESYNDRTSLLPYNLSAQYAPATDDGPNETNTGRPMHLTGIAYRQGTLAPAPIQGVAIYVQVSGQPSALLGETDHLGVYSGTLVMAEGQQVRIWAEKQGLTFHPEENIWSPDPRERSHRVVFVATGAILVQQTPPGDAGVSATPQPTLSPTAVASPTAAPTRAPGSK